MSIHVRSRQNTQALSRQASQRRRGFQIGPKIRIGGTLGHIGQQVKEGIGKVNKAAAPFVAMIPGVGQIAAPIMNIAGNALDTSGGGINSGNVGKIALQSALEAGGGALAHGAGSLLSKIPGASSLTDAVSHIPGASSIGDFLKGAGGKIGGMLGQAGDFAVSNPLEAAGIVSGALDQSKARGLETEALNSLRNAYDSKAGLRTQGVNGLLNPTPPDLSSVDYGSSRSVYGRKVPGVTR